MDARTEIHALFDELRRGFDQLPPKIADKFNSISDSLETRVMAQLEPLPEVDWRRYGLSRRHIRICDYLLAAKGRPRSKAQIMEVLYYDRSPDEWPEPKILDVFVCRMRHLFKRFDAPFQLETQWGSGYRLLPKNEAVFTPGRGKKVGPLHIAEALKTASAETFAALEAA